MLASRRMLLMSGGAPQAFRLAGAFTNVIAISTKDMSMVVRDSGTPANNYIGPVSGKATINGTLTPNPLGALFSNSNNLTFATSIVSWSWAEVGEYVEILPTTVDNATGDRVVSINDGTFSNTMEINILTTNSPDQVQQSCRVGGSTVVGIAPANGISLSGNTIRAGFKADDFAITLDGGTAAIDVGGAIPTVSRVDVGYSSHTASRGFKGRIPSIVIVPSRTAFLP